MARVLLAWEIGQNFGHVMPLISVARVLRSRGHQVAFAVKDLRQVSQLIRAEGFALWQAPVHLDLQMASKSSQQETMADILQLHGYDSVEALRAYLLAWRELLERTRAELLVASYAPTALLAAKTLDLRNAVIGTAFEIPPQISPLPSFRPWKKTSPADLHHSDATVVNVVNGVLSPFGKNIQSAFEVLSAHTKVLWTFPELDPFANERKNSAESVIYSGGLFPEKFGGVGVWPILPGPRVLAYLRYPINIIEALVDELSTMSATFLIVAPNLDEIAISKLTRANIHITSQAIQLAPALSSCDALMGYASHGTVCAALLSGKPMVLFPEHMEGLMLTKQVVRLGAAINAPSGDVQIMAKACAAILTNKSFVNAASKFMRRYKGYDPELQSARVAELFERSLESLPP